MFHPRLSICLLALLAAAVQAGEPGEGQEAALTSIAPRAAPLPLIDAVADKNFPFFRLLESRRARVWLRQDPGLAMLGQQHRQRVGVAVGTCEALAACYVEAVRWSDADIVRVAAALRGLCRNAAADCREIARALRISGTMIALHGRADADLLAAAWTQQIGAVMRALAVYGEGQAPRYKAIDAMSRDPQSSEFALQVRKVAQEILATEVTGRLFAADALQFALRLLSIDGRDEAGRLEPLERGENRAAHRQIRRVRWDRFPYAVILVPGSGPESLDVRLTPTARRRLELAVTRYRAQAAPFIVVSGGYVHPARTPYCEALEMKRTLVEEFKVPAGAVIIEPHARHTTTNLRNTVRLMFRYGMPMSKPGLIVSDEQQAAYIATDGFDARNRLETGIVPYSRKQRLSPLELSFVPAIEALQVGFEDPLDP